MIVTEYSYDILFIYHMMTIIMSYIGGSIFPFSAYTAKCGQRNYVAKPEMQEFTTKIDKSFSLDMVDHFCLYNITAPIGDRVAIKVVSLHVRIFTINCFVLWTYSISPTRSHSKQMW